MSNTVQYPLLAVAPRQATAHRRRVDLFVKAENSVALYANDQWVVTDYGMECLEAYYPIEAERLLETVPSGDYQWPLHMATKKWARLTSFFDAFLWALVQHTGRYSGSVDTALLQQGFDRAWHRKKREEAFSEFLAQRASGQVVSAKEFLTLGDEFDRQYRDSEYTG